MVRDGSTMSIILLHGVSRLAIAIVSDGSTMSIALLHGVSRLAIAIVRDVSTMSTTTHTHAHPLTNKMFR
jgi:hypothetical protein